MRFSLAAALLFATATAASAGECPVSRIEEALAAPLEQMKMTERPVTDIQSTEGGVWRIYAGADGTVHSVLRLDGGESGRGERRLSIVDGEAYGITVTRVDYLRHAFIDEAGPNGTAKRTTEYFYVCGGKLHLPPADFATPDLVAYAAAGEAAIRTMVLDKDVADVTKVLKR
jgi:hypothetical protein